MKTIIKTITAQFFQLTDSIGRSRVLDMKSDKLIMACIRRACRRNLTKQCCDRIRKITIKNKQKFVMHLAVLTAYSIFILFTSNIYSTTAHAASIVETFEKLKDVYHKEFKSDIYEVWVKPIFRNQPFTELDGIPDSEAPFNPELRGFEKSFTYKSVNDIASNDDDAHSKCYQYYYDLLDAPEDDYGNPTDPIQYRSESIPDDPANFGDHCNVNDDKQELFEQSYKIMTHSNNWTTFDVGHDNVGSHLGAVRMYIQLNSGHSPSNKGIKYDIRPKHVVETKDMQHTLGNNYKYIKVRAFGGEYVMEDFKLRFKKVLVLDVLQPQGTAWSGQFNVNFNDATIIDDIRHPYDTEASFQGEELKKHPLFIFANPLPKWYRLLADKSKYDGCPKNEAGFYLPNTEIDQPTRFYTPVGWDPGQVVETATYLDKDGILSDVIEPGGIRKVNDLILKSYSKRLCIPGGVYVKGRIIHHNKYHTNEGLKLKTGDPDLSPGDSGDYNEVEKKFNNAKGVKIVGRGILSGIHVKFRTKKKSVEVTECNTCPCQLNPTGGGWYGHLIDIRHRGEPYVYTDDENEIVDYTADAVKDQDGELDCFYRDERELGEDVNCVQGITMVDAPKASIYTGGSRMDIENVKIMSWHIETNGIGSAKGSKIKNVFIKANDDSIVMGKSHMNVDNATVWRQRWGSVVNLSWNLTGYRKGKPAEPIGYKKGIDLDPIENSHLDGLNVIRFDPGQTTGGNGNAAIVSARNMMGGTIDDFSFKNIVVEDPPYEIINLQLDDTNAYKATRRNLEQNQLDGTGMIKNITFDGLFTPKPYEVENTGETNPLSIQKSVFNISDEIFDTEYLEKCHQECDKECDALSIEKCNLVCDQETNLSSADPNSKDRSISGIKLDNIFIGNEDDIIGITPLNIYQYFDFKAGVNIIAPDPKNYKPHTEDDYYPYTGDPTDFNGIIGNDGLANSAGICASLQAVNKINIEELRKLRKSGSCPSSN